MKKENRQNQQSKPSKQQLSEGFSPGFTGGGKSQTVIGSLNNVLEYNNISTKADVIVVIRNAATWSSLNLKKKMDCRCRMY